MNIKPEQLIFRTAALLQFGALGSFIVEHGYENFAATRWPLRLWLASVAVASIPLIGFLIHSAFVAARRFASR